MAETKKAPTEDKEVEPAKEKVTMNFDRLKYKDLTDYIKKYHSEYLKEFEELSHDLVGKRKAVAVYEANGRPKLVLNAFGEFEIKKEMVEIEGSEKTKRLNLFKAKQIFKEKFSNEINFVKSERKRRKKVNMVAN